MILELDNVFKEALVVITNLPFVPTSFVQDNKASSTIKYSVSPIILVVYEINDFMLC